MYQRVLHVEPENLELRRYIADLISQINTQQAAAKLARQMDDLAVRQQGEADKASWVLPTARMAGSSAADIRPLRKNQGGMAPLSKEEFREELRRQADEARARKEAARRAEALLEKKETEVVEVAHRLDKYNNHVGGGNDKLAYQQEMRLALERERERRRQRIAEEHMFHATPGESGIFAGDGERVVNERQRQEYERRLVEQYSQRQQQADIWPQHGEAAPGLGADGATGSALTSRGLAWCSWRWWQAAGVSQVQPR
mmetsp:Transcript_17596/g.37998  ORF Transcript_17596/g.37998 Transcript_17596/m.37998 type:complete len:257 (+) Transcript_17596:1-771(+)